MGEKNPHYGATFAERKAIRLGLNKPKAEADAKAVESDEDPVENKAVSKRSTARKSKG